jgi:hypothetical protein
MIEATCECGAVRVEVEAPPETVGDCNCSICRRYGALWAYYRVDQVRVTGATTVYLRGTRQIEFHHCAVCRCLTHWSAVDKSWTGKMGVNARLMAPEVLKAAQVVPLDGASM